MSNSYMCVTMRSVDIAKIRWWMEEATCMCRGDLILMAFQVRLWTKSSAVHTSHLVLGAFLVLFQPETSAASNNFVAKLQSCAAMLFNGGTTIL